MNLLSWSRYLFARFYPRFSMEFFLDGHLEAFRTTWIRACSDRFFSVTKKGI